MSAVTTLAGNGASPVGHLTVDSTARIVRTEVTDFVNRQIDTDRTATFALIRELRFGTDTADDNRHALFNSTEAASDRPYLELWY